MPEAMHVIQEHHLLMFLIQMLLLLGLARGLGHLCRRAGQPPLLGEIVAGVLLGPTLLGRLAPAVQGWLFPVDAVQISMLDTVAWVGLFLLLLSAGLEVDVSVVWRQRSDSLKISISDIVLPMAIAFVPAWLLPDRYLGDPSQRLVFALFIDTVSTVSALPMTVKVLHDLDLLKSDLGLLAVSALTINDIIGWAIFTILLGFASGGDPGWGHVGTTIGGTVLFAAACMTIGRRIVSRGIVRARDSRQGDAGLVLTFVCCVGLLAGAATQWLGIHALFGFFLAGIMAGGSAALSERTRHVINQMVHAVFVPVFFATIGLRIDFISGFDLLPVAVLTVVGIGGRYLGAWVGARMTALSPEDRVTIAVAHTPGGSMEMVIGLIAWQFGLITLPVFVAIIFAAIVSSLLLGPWIAWSVRRRRQINVIELFDRRAIRLDVNAATRNEMLSRLAEAAAALDGMPPAESIRTAAQAREDTAGTAIGHEIAVPHARMAGLRRPLVVFGRSDGGLEWNAPDGLPVHLAFLILTPAQAANLQVQILAALARAMSDETTRQRLIHADTEDQAWTILREALADRSVAARPA